MLSNCKLPSNTTAKKERFFYCLIDGTCNCTPYLETSLVLILFISR